MKVISAGYEIIDDLDGIEILKKIERIGRTCYKSENLITKDGESAKRFVKMLVKRGHESVLEHYSFSVRFTVDRGVSHEIVRHRIASYSQESTRYCNYKGDLEFIDPRPMFDGKEDSYLIWYGTMKRAEIDYHDLINHGCRPEEARSVLPNSLKTELVMSANLREWRSVLKLRTAKAAHPQIREVMIPLLFDLQSQIPIIFDDIEVFE